MAKRMSELDPVLWDTQVWILTLDGRPTLIDGKKNMTGSDIVLLFSTAEKASEYARSYPSLRTTQPEPTTVGHLVDHFRGRVEYYIVDRPAAQSPP